MSEKLPARPSDQEIKLTITHEEAVVDLNKRELYRQERIAAIKAGQKVWMIRGFGKLESFEDPIVYDYYFKGLAWGFIEGNDLDGYEVYGAVYKTVEGQFEEKAITHLSMEPKENMLEAQQTLEDYVQGVLSS